MNKSIYLLGFLLFFLSCKAKKDTAIISPCIKEKIEDFKTDLACDSDFRVLSYSFQNETVYVFEEGDCGEVSKNRVLDTECQILGFLSVSSGALINGTDFNKAEFKAILWQQ